MATIAIDPGHGNKDERGSSGPGVRGARGALEKDVVMDVAQRVRQRLGDRVVLTRTGDANVSLAERDRIARDEGVRVFVSLHANCGAPGERGSEVLIHTRASEPSLDLAHALESSLARLGAPDLGVKRAELAVLTPERLPSGAAACLVEIDYLTDPAGESRLRDPNALDAISSAIAGGIDQFLAQPAAKASASRFGAPHGSHEQYAPRYGRAAVAVARAMDAPAWDWPANFPDKIRKFWSSAANRLLHEYWHIIRNQGWDSLTSDQQTDATNLGFSRPTRSDSQYGWGIDFFCMHRHMIETTRALAKKLGGQYTPTGWDPVPWDHNDKIWPMPNAPKYANRSFKQKGDPQNPADGTTEYWRQLLPTTYDNNDWLAQADLDDLGKEVENGFHGWMHMHWSTDPPANQRSLDPSNDWLGTFFSAHVNPRFWKLHGWIDDLINRWELAPTKATKAANKGPKRDANALFAQYCWEGKMPAVPASLGLALSDAGEGDSGSRSMVTPMPGVTPPDQPLTDSQLQGMVDRVPLEWDHFPMIGMSVAKIDSQLALNMPAAEESGTMVAENSPGGSPVESSDGGGGGAGDGGVA